MTDNVDKNQEASLQEASLIEAEAKQTDTQSQPASSFEPKSDHRSSGGGFVWLLAALLVIGGGGYAVWPYAAPTVEPVLKNVRAMFGLQPRPTQPSLPGVTPTETTAPVIASQPQPESVQAETSTTLPIEAPAIAAPVVEAPVDETPSVEAPVIEAPESVLPVTAMARDDSPEPATPQTDIAPMVQSLTERLDILETQVLTAASANRSTSQDDTAIPANGQLVRVLSELRADLATLKTRVAALENAPRGQIDPSASAQALVLSVTQLATQAQSDQPFAAALDALERIAGAEPVIATAVERLRAFAASGVPTQARIASDFKTVAVEVMKVHGQTQRTGWLDEVVGAASSLVTVRQTDPERIEDPVERALAVAERALNDNDLKTALAAMDSLQGSAGAVASRWRETARARVEIRDALEALHNRALAALAVTGGS
ncbi:COG4223 family protein [Magnetovibrio sp.]|uniref:COG4223 family protein n=1 Tax=Magnetovibrio sp. TaxID=2024836 RepID=UPI002F93A3CF